MNFWLIIIMFQKPEHLSRLAADAFDRVQGELQLAGITGAGFDVIERYAVTYALWFECQARVRSEGQAWGDGSRNQRMIDLHKLCASVAAIRRELGLGVLVQDLPRGDTAEGDDASSLTKPAGLSLRYNFGALNN